jgi:hypothetical protein
LHKGKSKTLKGTDVVTLQMAKDVYTLYGSTIPVGSCKYSYLLVVLKKSLPL